VKADQGRPWDFPAKTPSTESRHEKIPRTGAVSVPHSSFAQRAAPLARYSLPSGQVPPFRPNRQLVSSCIAESALGTRNRQDTPCSPGPAGDPHHDRRARPDPVTLPERNHNNEPDPDTPHLRQAAPRDIMTLMGHSPVTETLAPATRTRPAEIDRFREQTRLSRHARFVGATDNGRRERPDGPIWISVSICGQTPQS